MVGSPPSAQEQIRHREFAMRAVRAHLWVVCPSWGLARDVRLTIWGKRDDPGYVEENPALTGKTTR